MASHGTKSMFLVTPTALGFQVIDRYSLEDGVHALWCTGLLPYAPYLVRVSASNPAGCGDPSVIIYIMTQPGGTHTHIHHFTIPCTYFFLSSWARVQQCERPFSLSPNSSIPLSGVDHSSRYSCHLIRLHQVGVASSHVIYVTTPTTGSRCHQRTQCCTLRSW